MAGMSYAPRSSAPLVVIYSSQSSKFKRETSNTHSQRTDTVLNFTITKSLMMAVQYTVYVMQNARLNAHDNQIDYSS